MADTLYQTLYENRIEHCFECTTLETCTDVTYTAVEIWNQTTGEELTHIYDHSNDNWIIMQSSGSGTISLINISNLVKFVKTNLEKMKEVEVDLSDVALNYLPNFNDRLKLHGIAFRPTKRTFTKFTPKKQTPKVRPVVLNILRRITVSCVTSIYRERFLHDIKFEMTDTKSVQAQIVFVATQLGITKEDILTKPCHSVWRNGKYVQGTLIEYLTGELTERNEMCQFELTMAQYHKWYDKAAASLQTKEVKEPSS